MLPDIFGNFRLERFLGAGGMAEVFEASAIEGPLVGKPLAIKRLRADVADEPTFVELFITEAEVTRQLSHPNIIEVYEVGAVGDIYYIAMDFIDGRDLFQVMEQCRAREILLPIDFACFVAHVVAGALDFAHNAKGADGSPLRIIHCDVTPGNLFISHLGEIHLGDFGVAQSGVGNPTEILGIVGKARFLAPEQIEQRPLRPATDVFALGAILYELLTNERPFPAQEPEDIWVQIVKGRAPPPSAFRPDISPALDDAVLRALAPRVEGEPRSLLGRLGLRGRERFATARAFADALEPLYDPHIGTPLAIASVIRGLFGAPQARPA